MAECEHVFIGRSDGAHCTKCGLHLSGREYSDYCSAKQLALTGDNDAKQFIEDVENGEYCSDKPKRQTRKKVKADE